ncbi:MAG TPA: TspO/MBR family protein [Gammaproteobacteria bacterium]|nr:TspO/MBR family protein [Gammaproteobacteria bacterium]
MLRTWRTFSMLLFFVLLCLAVGQMGVFFTTTEAFNWYNTLNKPSWTPPSLAFPLVWTTIYIVMAVAVWLVWRAKQPHYRRAIVFWVIQLILNGLWTPLFFGHQGLLGSVILIDVLWLVLAITTFLFFKQSRVAGILMLIYLAWISFAGLLNFMIWQMN